MSPTNKVVFLSECEIFADLEEEELELLAEISEEVEYQAGAIVAYQRDLADSLVIVRSGRLYAYQVDNQGVVRSSRSYLPGDYFDDIWLFTPGTHPFTLRGTEDGRLILIDQKNFYEFLDEYPDLLEYLNLSEDARQAADNSRVGGKGAKVRSLSLLQDEMVEYYSRRSRWLLFLKVLAPIALFFLWAAFLLGSDFFSQAVSTFLLTLSVGVLLAFIAWRYLDWSNDYFVITNKHLIHHEFSLRRIQANVVKTPIDQIQSVEIEKPSLFATLFNTGTARVTTSAHTPSIFFDFISNPERVERTINRLREKLRAVDEGRAQTLMRSSIEEHFQATPSLIRVDEPLEDEVEYDEYETPLELIRRLMSGLFRGIGSRVEDGDVITYRKHFFTLSRRIWLPIAIGLGLVVIIYLIKAPTVELVLVGLLILDLLWLIWRFEDWRNDTFQLTDRYIIDVDRLPFGFGESRKQTELSNVQNVNATRPGFLATLFNYGYVYIETAGATADITFEKVVNPNRIQSDIFQRREEFKKHQYIRQGEERRKEYAVLIDVYQQALEQNRIPHRTAAEDTD